MRNERQRMKKVQIYYQQDLISQYWSLIKKKENNHEGNNRKNMRNFGIIVCFSRNLVKVRSAEDKLVHVANML